jgi:integrase
MPSLAQNPSSDTFYVRFRYGGRSYKRSLNTVDRRDARSAIARIDETIRLLERGRLAMPPHCDPAEFILSDGKLVNGSAVPPVVTLGELFKLYEERLPEGAKEPTTLSCEKIHLKHLKRPLKCRSVVRALTGADIQGYAQQRLKEKWHGKRIRTDTVRKELATLRMIWNWAVRMNVLDGQAPIAGIQFPKRDEKPPFMTLEQIERIVRRGGLTKDQERQLWDSLYLDRDQTQELLDHIKRIARHAFVYPLILFAAHTGARRSEILRSRIDDFDFEDGTVQIREKKKSKSLGTTFRLVELTVPLAEAMKVWLADHPGGQYVFVDERRMNGSPDSGPLTPLAAHKYLRRALKGTRWNHFRGFHVFRHSFASNLASQGVDQRIIDEWMGHTTDEMRRRYRHLLPEVRRRAIARLLP